MSDLYLEELVKRRRTGTDQALRYALMAVTAIGVVLSLLTWNLIIIAVSIAIFFPEISDRMGIPVCQRRTGCGPYPEQSKEKTYGILRYHKSRTDRSGSVSQI